MWSDSNRRDLWSARPCAPARTGKRKQTTKRLRPATVNPELACLKALFNYAIKSDLPLTNPVSRVKFLKEQNERTRVLTCEEQEKYLAAATTLLRDVATLTLETGMRPEEAALQQIAYSLSYS